MIYRIVESEPVEEIPLAADGTPGEPHGRGLFHVRAGQSCMPTRRSSELCSVSWTMRSEAYTSARSHGQPEVPVVLDPPMLQRHVLIVGGVGSGKSYTRGVLAEELRSLGVAQVNIDVNGEMIEAASQLSGATVRPGDGFTIPLSALTSEDLIEAIAGVQRGTNIETLIGYSFNVLQRQVVQNRRAVFGVADLVQEIADQAPNLNMAQANTLRPAQLRTQALDRLPYIGPQFDWRATLTPGAFLNIDCRTQLLPDLRVITAAVARDLQNLARRREIPFTILSIDEFHLVAPNDDRNVSTQVLREIAPNRPPLSSGPHPHDTEPGRRRSEHPEEVASRGFCTQSNPISSTRSEACSRTLLRRWCTRCLSSLKGRACSAGSPRRCATPLWLTCVAA